MQRRVRGAIAGLDREIAEVEGAVPPLDQVDLTSIGRLEGQIGHPREDAAAFLGEIGLRRAIEAEEPAVVLEAGPGSARCSQARKASTSMRGSEDVSSRSPAVQP